MTMKISILRLMKITIKNSQLRKLRYIRISIRKILKNRIRRLVRLKGKIVIKVKKRKDKKSIIILKLEILSSKSRNNKFRRNLLKLAVRSLKIICQILSDKGE
jgi:hypothetical protein